MTTPIETMIADLEEDLRYSTMNPCLPITVQREHLVALIKLAKQALDPKDTTFIPKVYHGYLLDWNYMRANTVDGKILIGPVRAPDVDAQHRALVADAAAHGATIEVIESRIFAVFEHGATIDPEASAEDYDLNWNYLRAHINRQGKSFVGPIKGLVGDAENKRLAAEAARHGATIEVKQSKLWAVFNDEPNDKTPVAPCTKCTPGIRCENTSCRGCPNHVW